MSAPESAAQLQPGCAVLQPRQSKAPGRRRWALWLLVIAGLVCLAFVLGVLNNNYSLGSVTGAELAARRDQSLNRALDWIAANRGEIEDNPTLMFMVWDMERKSHDPRLLPVLQHYQAAEAGHPKSLLDAILLRQMDPTVELPVLRVPDMHGSFVDFYWFSHAIAPDRVLLTPADEANLFSRTRWTWGKRQKQLLALALYRDFNGSTPELDQTIDYISGQMARDAYYDFRVSDSYMQRNAFLLVARHPELVRPRWVERILDRQNADGSWDYCWHGWCRGIAEFGFKRNPGHSTTQAAWALTLLKYQYPEWPDGKSH